MHTTSVEEDGVYYGENRTCLPLPLDGALQPSCGKADAEPAGTRVEEDCRVADGGAAAGSDWPPAAIEESHQPGRDTNSLTKQIIFGCTMPTKIQAMFSLRRNIIGRRGILVAPITLRNRRVRN